ncbi:MAG: hypothetical protein ACRDHY_07165 [Anaerolineales bacterium]
MNPLPPDLREPSLRARPSPGTAERPNARLLFAAAAAGLVLGLVYGWGIRPVEYSDTSPDSLRADYRTDYVLMVAEAYEAEGALDRAIQRLAALGPRPAFETATQAVEYARGQGFSAADIERLEALAGDLKALAPTAEISGP